jgi:glycosyltransferase involved in cell wall biosynthesis
LPQTSQEIDKHATAPRPRLSVIIPVYNEARTVQEVVRRLEKLDCSKEILIVDDGSSDGTTEQIRNLARGNDIRALFHARNQGKGAAVRTAMEQVRGDIVVIQDADLEYDPAEIERLLQPILDDEADVVYGSRFAAGSQSSSGKLHRTANGFLTWLSNRVTGLRLSDMETCYKAMKRDVTSQLSLREQRFGFEPEITAKVAKRGWRVVEIPISYEARGRSAGKKIGFRDGLRAIWCILRYSWWD